jgi:hypothetical protein
MPACFLRRLLGSIHTDHYFYRLVVFATKNPGKAVATCLAAAASIGI